MSNLNFVACPVGMMWVLLIRRRKVFDFTVTDKGSISEKNCGKIAKSVASITFNVVVFNEKQNN